MKISTIINNLASLILPVSVLIIIPLLIERSFSVVRVEMVLVGFPLLGLGIYLLVNTISLFIRIGEGTLAPWKPPRKLITTGLYRHVRNPMIIGVLIVLVGESVTFLSIHILLWAILFFISNNIYFVLFEEPQLKRRYGKLYLHYKKRVPRWIPKLKPYSSRFKPNNHNQKR